MKKLILTAAIAVSGLSFGQEIAEQEEAINNPVILHERAPETVTETYFTPISEEVIENEKNIITTTVFKNITVVKTEPKQ